jgi:hypothetical protein
MWKYPPRRTAKRNRYSKSSNSLGWGGNQMPAFEGEDSAERDSAVVAQFPPDPSNALLVGHVIQHDA